MVAQREIMKSRVKRKMRWILEAGLLLAKAEGWNVLKGAGGETDEHSLRNKQIESKKKCW